MSKRWCKVGTTAWILSNKDLAYGDWPNFLLELEWLSESCNTVGGNWLGSPTSTNFLAPNLRAIRFESSTHWHASSIMTVSNLAINGAAAPLIEVAPKVTPVDMSKFPWFVKKSWPAPESVQQRTSHPWIILDRTSFLISSSALFLFLDSFLPSSIAPFSLTLRDIKSAAVFPPRDGWTEPIVPWESSQSSAALTCSKSFRRASKLVVGTLLMVVP